MEGNLQGNSSAYSLRKKSIRSSKSDLIFDIINYSLLIIILLSVLYPLWFIIIASFSDSSKVLAGDVWLYPKGFHFGAYERVFKDSRIMMGYKNTIIYTVCGTFLNICATTAAAYPLSRKDFAGRNVLTAILAFTMFFSGGLIPTYLVYKQIEIVNTFWVMVLPGMVSVYNMVIMRTFFADIPFDLQEAAFMDGASNFQILFRIILPLSAPVIAVMVMFYGVGHWNSFFNALVFLTNKKLYPLQLIIRDILIVGASATSEGTGDSSIADKMKIAEALKYSVIVVSSLPVLALYPMLQKYFIRGVMVGAIKG